MMNLSLLIDNDVLIKCSSYLLLDKLSAPENIEGEIGILGSAPFVVKDCIQRRGAIKHRESAQKCFDDYLSSVVILEPTIEELSLASAIEEIAIEQGLDLDGGESQLCAIAISRATPFLLTGDKRAIRGAEMLQASIPALTSLARRFVCLEQAIISIVAKIGQEETRALICTEPDIDKTLSICFSCHSRTALASLDGLNSYINNIGAQAPTLLHGMSEK